MIFGQGKTPAQVVAIARRLLAHGGPVLVTRADEAARAALRDAFPEAEVHERARCVVIRRARRAPRRRLACWWSARAPPTCRWRRRRWSRRGSWAAAPRSSPTSAWRASTACSPTGGACASARVIVVVAGMEGALASVVGGLVDRPVIAVPTSVGYGAHFRGLAPLLAMLNSCAAGVTVVNIDNGFGAGYAAHLVNVAARRR